MTYPVDLLARAAFVGLLRLSLCGVMVVGLTTVADAQITPEEQKALEKEKISLRLAVSKMHREGTVSDDQKLARYLEIDLQLFAHDPAIDGLSRKRDVLVRELRTSGNAPAQAVHQKMLDTLLTGLSEIVRNKALSMPVRYNGALMLADLNKTEPPLFGTGVIPVALPAAQTVLLEMWADPDLEDAIKAAVLLGLVRQAESRPVGQQGDELRTMLLALMNQATPPAGRSAEGQDWFRRRAAQGLGALGQLGGDGSVDVLQGLIAMINDKSASFSVRCEAARALGALQYSSRSNVNHAQIAKPLGNLGMDVIRQHDNRRALKHFLNCVLTGLRGPEPEETGSIAAVTNPEQKMYVNGVLSQLDNLSSILDGKLPDEQAVDEVKGQSTQLDTYLQQNQPPGNSLTAAS